MMPSAFVKWLHHGPLDRTEAGGKGASLSELLSAGFPVPAGFCVTTDAYRRFAVTSGLDGVVRTALSEMAGDGDAGVRATADRISEAVAAASLPDDLREAISRAYEQLSSTAGPACAVRSSSVSEDGAGASFAGLYDSYLNVRGDAAILAAVQSCYASLWSERALRYRATKRRGGSDEAMAVVVMELVPAEAAGVAFTAHPVTGARDQIVINACWGLGETVVGGRVTPDSFVFHKGSLALLQREIFTKEIAAYPNQDAAGTIERRLPPARAAAPSLSDEQARAVARLAAAVEARDGRPQDLEWALHDGQIFLLQSRPITTL